MSGFTGIADIITALANKHELQVNMDPEVGWEDSKLTDGMELKSIIHCIKQVGLQNYRTKPKTRKQTVWVVLDAKEAPKNPIIPAKAYTYPPFVSGNWQIVQVEIDVAI